jgi:hypothetical protein
LPDPVLARDSRGQKNKQALAEAIAKHLKDEFFGKK